MDTLYGIISVSLLGIFLLIIIILVNKWLNPNISMEIDQLSRRDIDILRKHCKNMKKTETPKVKIQPVDNPHELTENELKLLNDIQPY